MSNPSDPKLAAHPDILLTEQFLTNGQYMATADSSIYALLGNDGRFALCSGSGPADPNARLIVQYPRDPGKAGKYFIQMQGDGNLVIYHGTGPDDNQGFVWGLNLVRKDMPRPHGKGYQAVLTSDNLSVYDRNPGHDPLEGPYWSMWPKHQPEEEFTATEIKVIHYLEPAQAGQRPRIRFSIQPQFTCELTRVTLSMSSAAPGTQIGVDLAVFRGGFDSTDLMNRESFAAGYLDPNAMLGKEKLRQTYDFNSPPLLVAWKIYTLELSTSPDVSGAWLRVGLLQEPKAPLFDGLMGFTAWTKRP